jgi:hypothetical protein
MRMPGLNMVYDLIFEEFPECETLEKLLNHLGEEETRGWPPSHLGNREGLIHQA